MKKIIMSISLTTLLLISAFSVSASEPEEAFVSNMDSATYREQRTAQVEKAYSEDKITEDEYTELLEHVNEVADNGTFGKGPSYGAKGDGNATCVLGEDSTLGIFRSESAGMRTGNGNGMGIQSQDGTGAGNGNRGNKGNGQGAGQGSRGQGNAGVCIVAE